MSGIYQSDIFFNVMDDDEPMFMVTDYIHILSKNPLFNEDVIYDIIIQISGLEVLNKVSLARLRNMFKEFFFNGNVRMPARGNVFEDRYFFNNFDDTAYVSGLKDILLTVKDRNAFYSGLRQLIRYFLPLSEMDLDGEIKALFKEDDDKFFSPGREAALKKAIGEIFIRRLGENALGRVMKFLSGNRDLAFVPSIDILPIALNKGDNADNYESLRGLPKGDINYDFVFGQESGEAVDWVSRLFSIFPKINPSDDAYNSGSPVGPVKIKPLQDKYRKAKGLLTNGSFLNSIEIFEGMLDELKRAEKYGKLGLTAINLKRKVENGLREIKENEKREGLKRQVKREHLKKKPNRKGKSPKKEASDVRNARKHLNVDVSGPGSSPVIPRNTPKECLLINYNYNEGHSNIFSITSSSAISYIERLGGFIRISRMFFNARSGAIFISSIAQASLSSLLISGFFMVFLIAGILISGFQVAIVSYLTIAGAVGLYLLLRITGSSIAPRLVSQYDTIGIFNAYKAAQVRIHNALEIIKSEVPLAYAFMNKRMVNIVNTFLSRRLPGGFVRTGLGHIALISVRTLYIDYHAIIASRSVFSRLDVTRYLAAIILHETIHLYANTHKNFYKRIVSKMAPDEEERIAYQAEELLLAKDTIRLNVLIEDLFEAKEKKGNIAHSVNTQRVSIDGGTPQDGSSPLGRK